MTYEWAKERNEALHEFVFRPDVVGKDAAALGAGFYAGADFGRDYEQKRAAELVEALNEILAYAQDSDQRRETARLALAAYESNK